MIWRIFFQWEWIYHFFSHCENAITLKNFREINALIPFSKKWFNVRNFFFVKAVIHDRSLTTFQHSYVCKTISRKIAFCTLSRRNLTEKLVKQIYKFYKLKLVSQCQWKTLQEMLSKVILELQKDRYFETLQGKYWNSTMRNNCPVLDDSEGITLRSLGMFWRNFCQISKIYKKFTFLKVEFSLPLWWD